MYGGVKNGDASIIYGYMNIHTGFQQNGSKSLMNYNYGCDTDRNSNLHHGYVSSGIGLLNIHTLSQCNESSKLNEINMGAENGDVNSGHCYMNSATGYEAKNLNNIVSTNKRD